MTTRTNAVRAVGIVSGALAIFSAAPAWAATLTVNNGTDRCPHATYTTIQSAIDAASANDEVLVCAGTYVEQITIPSTKNGLTVRAHANGAVTIQAPATMADPGDIVRINGARDVTLADVTVAGPLPDALFCSTLLRTGIRIDGGGSATIKNDRITDIRSADPALRGCQNGVPILVGDSTEGETGSARISHDTIVSYEKTGVVVDNAGSSATIDDTTVTGDGPLTTIAQNGIQISNGATAEVRGNTVSGQIYSPTPLASGILLFFSGAVTVIGNQVEGADYGIVTVGTPSPEIRNNTIAACTADGIDIDEDVTGTTNAVVVGNHSSNNGEDGLYVSPASTGSLIRDNTLSSNAAFDARDDSTGSGTAGTASTWRHDQCVSDNHDGRLCRR